MPCSADSSEYCGAGNRLNVYWSGAKSPPPPITVQSIGNWTSLGCYRYIANMICQSISGANIPYSDSTANRVLSYGATVTGSVTIESCTTACYNAGYPLAGAEYADECCPYRPASL